MFVSDTFLDLNLNVTFNVNFNWSVMSSPLVYRKSSFGSNLQFQRLSLSVDDLPLFQDTVSLVNLAQVGRTSLSEDCSDLLIKPPKLHERERRSSVIVSSPPPMRKKSIKPVVIEPEPEPVHVPVMELVIKPHRPSEVERRKKYEVSFSDSFLNFVISDILILRSSYLSIFVCLCV